MTDIEATEAFLKDLKAVLRKHDVEIILESETHGYDSIPYINFYSNGKYDPDSDLRSGHIDFNKTYLDGDED